MVPVYLCRIGSQHTVGDLRLARSLCLLSICEGKVSRGIRNEVVVKELEQSTNGVKG